MHEQAAPAYSVGEACEWALRELALEGEEGCTVRELRARLKACGGAARAAAENASVWAHVLQFLVRTTTVAFYERGARLAAPQLTATGVLVHERKLIASKALAHLTDGGNGSAVGAADVRLVADARARLRALALEGMAPGAQLYCLLETIGRGRADGVPSLDLCAATALTSKVVFYLLKDLRGCTPPFVTADRVHNKTSTQNLFRLRHLQPSAPSATAASARASSADAGAPSADVAARTPLAGGGADASSSSSSSMQDAFEMALRALPSSGVISVDALEAVLRDAFGDEWQAARALMFEARIIGMRTGLYLGLLDEVVEVSQDADRLTVLRGLERARMLSAEVPLVRQLLDLVAAKGSVGVTSAEMFALLSRAVNMPVKAVHRAIQQLTEVYPSSVRRVTEHGGRTQQYRYFSAGVLVSTSAVAAAAASQPAAQLSEEEAPRASAAPVPDVVDATPTDAQQAGSSSRANASDAASPTDLPVPDSAPAAPLADGVRRTVPNERFMTMARMRRGEIISRLVREGPATMAHLRAALCANGVDILSVDRKTLLRDLMWLESLKRIALLRVPLSVSEDQRRSEMVYVVPGTTVEEATRLLRQSTRGNGGVGAAGSDTVSDAASATDRESDAGASVDEVESAASGLGVLGARIELLNYLWWQDGPVSESLLGSAVGASADGPLFVAGDAIDRMPLCLYDRLFNRHVLASLPAAQDLAQPMAQLPAHLLKVVVVPSQGRVVAAMLDDLRMLGALDFVGSLRRGDGGRFEVVPGAAAAMPEHNVFRLRRSLVADWWDWHPEPGSAVRSVPARPNLSLAVGRLDMLRRAAEVASLAVSVVVDLSPFGSFLPPKANGRRRRVRGGKGASSMQPLEPIDELSLDVIIQARLLFVQTYREDARNRMDWSLPAQVLSPLTPHHCYQHYAKWLHSSRSASRYRVHSRLLAWGPGDLEGPPANEELRSALLQYLEDQKQVFEAGGGIARDTVDLRPSVPAGVSLADVLQQFRLEQRSLHDELGLGVVPWAEPAAQRVPPGERDVSSMSLGDVLAQLFVVARTNCGLTSESLEALSQEHAASVAWLRARGWVSGELLARGPARAFRMSPRLVDLFAGRTRGLRTILGTLPQARAELDAARTRVDVATLAHGGDGSMAFAMLQGLARGRVELEARVTEVPQTVPSGSLAALDAVRCYVRVVSPLVVEDDSGQAARLMEAVVPRLLLAQAAKQRAAELIGGAAAAGAGVRAALAAVQRAGAHGVPETELADGMSRVLRCSGLAVRHWSGSQFTIVSSDAASGAAATAERALVVAASGGRAHDAGAAESAPKRVNAGGDASVVEANVWVDRAGRARSDLIDCMARVVVASVIERPGMPSTALLPMLPVGAADVAALIDGLEHVGALHSVRAANEPSVVHLLPGDTLRWL